MRLPTIDLNLLVALDALLREASVSKAAERVGISPSAMSHALARLRRLLDDPVLERAGRNMVPTARAQRMAEPLRRSLETLEGLLEADEVEPGRLARGFRVMATDHVVSLLQPGVEAILQSEAPLVDLFVAPWTPTTMENLRDGSLDLAVGIFPEAPGEMRTRKLFEDDFVTVTREGRIDDLDLDAYLSLRHLLVAVRGATRGYIDDVLSAQGLERHVARTVPHFLAAAFLVAETDLAVTMSRRLATRLADRLPLDLHETPLPVEPYPIGLLWHPRADADPAHRYLREVYLRATESLS